MKVTNKEYICGICDTQYHTQTNHFDEIYTPCKVCGNSVLYCNEVEALEIYGKRDKSYFKLHHYRFNTSLKLEAIEYEKLTQKLSEFNLVTDTCQSHPTKYSAKWDYISDMDNSNIIIYNKDTFDNQYIAKGMRLYDWCQADYPNKKIKEGYYLEYIGEFDYVNQNNIFRNRHYGLRIGDIVSYLDNEFLVHRFTSDNNCAILLDLDGNEIRTTAESCSIIKKVEDIQKEIKDV